MPRLFTGIEIPAEQREEIARLKLPLPGGSRWTDPDDLHLTLRFVGEVDESVARDIDNELGRIVEAPFEMALAGAGSFGGKEPNALWAGVNAPPDLARLAASCESAVRRAGLPAEGRKYKPHVTLAYCHGTTDVEVARFLEATGDFRTETFWVDHFCMYSSRGTRSGSVYVEEAVYPLAGTQQA